MIDLFNVLDEYERIKKPSILYPDKKEFERALEPYTINQLYEILNTLIDMEEYDYCSIVQKRLDYLEQIKYK